MKLFDRKWKLIVKPYEGKSFSNFAAGEDLSDLDFTFEAKKTSIPLQPNTLKLSIFNLSKATRSMLESGKNRVILEAGYKERDDVTAFGGGTGMAKIFNGQVRAAWSDGGKGPDWVTHLDTGDGFMEMALAQLNVNLEPKVSQGRILKTVANGIGLKTGNLDRQIDKFAGKLGALTGARTVIHGNAANIFNSICDSAGLEWSVQDGELQVMEKGSVVDDGIAPLVSPDTGLLGSPSFELKSAGSFSNNLQIQKSVALNKPGHLVTFESLIIPGLKVGGKVKVESDDVNGAYKILQLEYRGATRGDDWTVKVTASKYSAAS